MVGQRLDPLPPAIRVVLATAAVIGAVIDVRVVAAAGEHPVTEVLTALDVAFAAGLVTHPAGPPAAEFCHALVRDTLLAQVPSARRLVIHRRAAEHIEAAHRDDLDRHAAELAHHSLSALPAADARAAVAWAERAAAGALAELACEEAARLYERALQAMGPGGFRPADRCRLLLGRASTLFKSGDVRSAIAVVTAAGQEARRAGDPAAMAHAALAFEGVADEAWGQQVVRFAGAALPQLAAGELELRARLTAALATAHSFTLAGDAADQAQPLSQRALELAEASAAPNALASALRARQMACAGPDGVDVRLETADRMLTLAAQTGDPWAALWGRLLRIEARCQLGETDAAEADIAPLAHIVERLRQPVAAWHLARTRCALAMGRGRFDEAGPLPPRDGRPGRPGPGPPGPSDELADRYQAGFTHRKP